MDKKKEPRDPYRLIRTTLSSRYDLLEYAGGGGMGAVYRAADKETGNVVAVKILKPDIVSRNPEYIELFGREVKAAQQLSHSNIVKLFDSGIEEDIAYMVMEWLDGRLLEDVINEGRLPLDRIVTIFEQVCNAISCAHENNIIHLDLKPTNIMLIEREELDDFVKVIDFGLARVIGRESGTTVTHFRGTHQFCAPEQFGGRVSKRSDIYSLGATLYFLISGVVPFSTSYINAKMHPNLELPEVPSPTKHGDLPSKIDNVIRKALNKDPNLRQQSASQLFEEFYLASLADTLISEKGLARKKSEDTNKLAEDVIRGSLKPTHNLFDEDSFTSREGVIEVDGSSEGYDIHEEHNVILSPNVPAIDKDRLTFAVPIAVVLAKEITPLADKTTPSGQSFREGLSRILTDLYYDLGVSLPSCFVSGDAPLKSNQYFIAIKEVPVVYGSVKPDCVYVNDSAENIRLFGLAGEDVRNPADLKPGAWIPVSQRNIAELAKLKVWEPGEVITLHLSMVLKKYAHEFLGVQEAQALLDFVARDAPKLVEEVVPKVVTIHLFTDVLQRLVQEGISIRDVKTILDSLSEWGRIEKDPVMLTEYVRCSMKRYISFRYAQGRDTLFVYLLDPEIEDVIRSAIRRFSIGTFLSLDPAIAHDIIDAIRREVANLPPNAQQPIIIADMELRRFVRKLVELEFPTLAVLSYQELAPELEVQPVGRISLIQNNS